MLLGSLFLLQLSSLVTVLLFRSSLLIVYVVILVQVVAGASMWIPFLVVDLVAECGLPYVAGVVFLCFFVAALLYVAYLVVAAIFNSTSCCRLAVVSAAAQGPFSVTDFAAITL
jgi:hypothetical protein